MATTLALSFAAVNDGGAPAIARFLGSVAALAEGRDVEGDLGLRRRDGYLVVRLSLDATDAIVARLRFWCARAGGNAAVADDDMGAECELRLAGADVARRGVAAPELGEAFRAMLLECRAAPVLAEVGSDGLPVLRLQVLGPGWSGVTYDPDRRTAFVPTPLAPPPGDELVLQLEALGASRPAVRARARVLEASADCADRATAGFSAALSGESDAVHRVLSATCPPAPGHPFRRAAQRYRSTAPVQVVGGHGNLVDISCGGAFIRTPHRAPIGAEVRVEVRLPNETVQTTARVVHARPDGMGIEFHPDGGAQAALASAMTSLVGRRRRVLVVDDDALARRMLADAFEDEGFDVVTAHDAEFAMRTLADQLLTLDLLVTDVVMPRVDGELLVRSIRRLGGESDLPIVVVSGRVDAATRERLLLAGADGVVAKSLGAGSIVRMAEGVMARRQADAAALETVA